MAGRMLSIWFSFSSVPHDFWILSFLCWSNILFLDPKNFNTLDIFSCTMSHLPLHKIFKHIKIPKILYTEDNSHDVQTAICTKSLYHTKYFMTLNTKPYTVYCNVSCFFPHNPRKTQFSLSWFINYFPQYLLPSTEGTMYHRKQLLCPFLKQKRDNNLATCCIFYSYSVRCYT